MPAPDPPGWSPRRPERRRSRALRGAGFALVAGLALAILAGGAVWSDAFGVGERFEHLQARVARFIAGPVPDRSTAPDVIVTPRPWPAPSPSLSPTPSPPATPTGNPASSASPSPSTSPSPSPPPVRTRVDVRLPLDPDTVFASQLHKDWCAVAGTQMVLAALGLADNGAAFQQRLAARIGEWESWKDSHNGGWGPTAISLALDAYGASGYQVRAYASRADALRGAAVAVSETGKPVVLVAWRGAHTWIMTGYRADADPLVFPDANVEGTYIYDPWYPRVSSIWGPSDPAGTYQDGAEMKRNYLPWKRPEGKYPERDGRFLIVAPTTPIG